MGIKWNELVSTDPNAAWSLASIEIAKEMFQLERIIVPRLEEAQYFDLMACFAKKGEKTALEKIFFVSVACQNFVKADLDQKLIYQDWKSPDGQKEVKISFYGLSRKVINWVSLKKGSLIFNSDPGSILYIISDVVYASQTSISVKIDGKERSKRVSKKIPVAFSFAKLKIDQSGELKYFIDEKELDVAYPFAPTNFWWYVPIW